MYKQLFPSFYGVRQGDSLSPTLFSIFLNDLANSIKSAKLGIDIGTKNIEILIYADDVALTAEDENKLQSERYFKRLVHELETEYKSYQKSNYAF